MYCHGSVQKLLQKPTSFSIKGITQQFIPQVFEPLTTSSSGCCAHQPQTISLIILNQSLLASRSTASTERLTLNQTSQSRRYPCFALSPLKCWDSQHTQRMSSALSSQWAILETFSESSFQHDERQSGRGSYCLTSPVAITVFQA